MCGIFFALYESPPSNLDVSLVQIINQLLELFKGFLVGILLVTGT